MQTIQASQKVWANALAVEMDEAQLRTASAVLAQLQQALGAQETPQE